MCEQELYIKMSHILRWNGKSEKSSNFYNGRSIPTSYTNNDQSVV